MFDYKLIQALDAVVQEGGFDKAAKRLLITQSAVSQRVKLLEDQAGQVLLARTSPPRATSFGRKMLKHYLQVKRLEDDLWLEMDQGAEPGPATLAVGLNADSLSTWFMEAVQPFALENRVLLDLRIDDQAQTHRLLKDGEVMGCISTQEKPMQGCKMAFLGTMNYRLMATPEFVAAWFPEGLSLDQALKAPALVFNRDDKMHHNFFLQITGQAPGPFKAHYVPSSETFVDFITSGLSYGLLPDQQSSPFITSGRLIDLAPRTHIPVKLYWHCWNLKSKLLEELTRHLVSGGQAFLRPLPTRRAPWQTL